MERRTFLMTATGPVGLWKPRTADRRSQECVQFLTPGRSHRLLASEIADGLTLRVVEGTDAEGLSVAFNRYDVTPEVFRSLRLNRPVTSAGVYVRGSVRFSLRLAGGSDAVPQTHTAVVFAQRAKVQVFSERDPGWPAEVAQIIAVATPDVSKSGR